MKLFLKILVLVAVIGCVVALAYLLTYANEKQREKPIEEMLLFLKQEAQVLMKEEDVVRYVEEVKLSPVGKKVSAANPLILEKALSMHPYLKNVQVYLSLDNKLRVDLAQRVAVLRVQNIRGDVFYLDDEGVILPVNKKYPQRLRLLNGNIRVKDVYGFQLSNTDSLKHNKLLYDAFVLSEYIRADKFLDAQIEQIYVNGKGEFELFPTVGGQLILFGRIDDMEDKFNRLKLLYKEGFVKKGWDAYSTINLKYKNQAICTKI